MIEQNEKMKDFYNSTIFKIGLSIIALVYLLALCGFVFIVLMSISNHGFIGTLEIVHTWTQNFLKS